MTLIRSCFTLSHAAVEDDTAYHSNLVVPSMR